MISKDILYTFSYKGRPHGILDEITVDHLDEDYISENIFDYFDFWSELEDSIAKVVSVDNIKKLAVVNLTNIDGVWDEGWWFTVKFDELTPLSGNKECKCNGRALLDFGCRCGGV